MREIPPSPPFPKGGARILLGVLALFALLQLAGCASERYARPSKGMVQRGMASWYGPKFHGKPTASGEIYDMNQLSAAHRELPLGTMIHVKNLDNGRQIEVRVNDRGPFVRGRVLDLSLGAAPFIREGLKVRADELDQLRDALREVREAQEKLKNRAREIFGQEG